MDCATVNQKDIFILHCPYCSFLTLVLSKLLEHFKMLHSTIDCVYSLYECFHCGIISTSSALLAEHSSIAHVNEENSVRCIYQSNNANLAASGDMEYSCLFCCYRAVEPKNLTLHYFAFHNVKNVAPLFTCSAYSVQPTSMSVKLANSISKASTACTTNDNQKYLMQKSDMSDHLQPQCGDMENSQLPTSPNNDVPSTSVHSVLDDKLSPSASILRPFKCTHCGNTYRKRKYFAEHVISCSKTFQLTCPCGRACKWRSNFYAHRKSCAVYNQLLFGNGGCSVQRRRPFPNDRDSPQSGLPTVLDSQLQATTIASLPGCSVASDIVGLTPLISGGSVIRQNDPLRLWGTDPSAAGIYPNGLLGGGGDHSINYNDMLNSMNANFPNVFALPTSAPSSSGVAGAAVGSAAVERSANSVSEARNRQLAGANSNEEDDDCIVLKEEAYSSENGLYSRSSLSFSDVGVGVKHTSNR